MPREITKTVYTFRELLEAAKDPASPVTERAVDRARDWLREGATDHDWWDTLLDEWKEALGQVGFEDADIRFSGFGSQGDGASFTAAVDVPKLATFLAAGVPPGGSADGPVWPFKEMGGWCDGTPADPRYRRLARLDDHLTCHVERLTHQYAHANTCRFRGDLDERGTTGGKPDYEWRSDQPRVRKLAEAFFADAEALRQDLCHAIYKSLEGEYDWRTADEQLAEDSAMNDWTFDAYGDRDG